MSSVRKHNTNRDEGEVRLLQVLSNGAVMDCIYNVYMVGVMFITRLD